MWTSVTAAETRYPLIVRTNGVNFEYFFSVDETYKITENNDVRPTFKKIYNTWNYKVQK